jgi:hypothetical protein
VSFGKLLFKRLAMSFKSNWNPLIKEIVTVSMKVVPLIFPNIIHTLNLSEKVGKKSSNEKVIGISKLPVLKHCRKCIRMMAKESKTGVGKAKNRAGERLQIPAEMPTQYYWCLTWV